MELVEGFSSGCEGHVKLTGSNVDFQTGHSGRQRPIEEGNDRPSALVIDTDDILVFDHDVLNVSSLDVDREKLGDILFLAFVFSELINVKSLLMIVGYE